MHNVLGRMNALYLALLWGQEATKINNRKIWHGFKCKTWPPLVYIANYIDNINIHGVALVIHADSDCIHDHINTQQAGT